MLNLGRVLELRRVLKLNRLLAVFFYLLCLPVLAANLPDYYQEPGFNSFRNVKLGQFGESIDPFNGGLQLHISPIVIPGNGGLDINIQLNYRSISKQNTQIGNDHQSWHSPFGVGWDLHMGRIWPSSSQSCTLDSCAPVLELADGTRRSLVPYTGTAGFDLITTDRWAAKFDAAKNQYIVYSPEGVKYYFSTVGHAVAPGSGFAYSVNKIVDANSNTIVVEYLTDDNHQLVNKVYFLGEEGSGVNLSYEAKGQYYYLQSIANKSQTWKFTYTPVKQVSIGYYFLTGIDPPEMNTWQLEYLDPSENTNSSNPNLFNLVKMISPTGVTSAYNYVAKIFDDSPQFTPILTVAVATKTVSGGDVTPGTWTYNYEPGNGSTNSITTITTPAATEKYTYFSAKQAGSGDVWQIGTLQQQQWLSGNSVLKQVDYVWEPEKISDMGVYHRRRSIDNAPVFDPVTWIPRLVQRNTSISVNSDTGVNGGTNQFNASFQNYDAFGNAQTIVEGGYNQGDASTRTRNFTFDVKSVAWILHLVSSEKLLNSAGTIEHTYDAAGRLTKDNQFGVITQYSRCDNGEIKTLTNANAHKTNYGCDYKNGIPTSEQRVVDLSTGDINISRTVDASGRVKSESIGSAYLNTDGSLSTLTTAYTWDAMNRLTSISTPEIGDSNIGITWSKDGRTRTLTRGDYAETQTTDGVGNVISQTYNDLTQILKYDALGRKTFASNLGNTKTGTSLSYDDIGRQQIIDPPGNGQINYTYLTNNQIKISDQRGNETTYRYRAYDDSDSGLLTGIANSNSSSTQINRDDWGLMTSVVQGGVTRSYNYNTKHQLTQITHPEIDAVKLGRDALGNMISLQIGSGALTQFTYNALEQLNTIDYADPNTPDETRTYTKTGQLSSATTNGLFRWDYRYTRNDHLSQESLTYLAGSPINAGTAKTFKMLYRYNSRDQVINMIYPSRLNYQKNYDALGRPTQMRVLNGVYLIQAAQYWANGQLQQLVYGNNKTTRYEQSSQLKITSATTGDVDPTDKNPNDGFAILNAVAQEAYTYDGKGLLTALNDQLQPTYGFNTIGYDSQDRLTHINNVEVYRYDAQHNMTYNNLGGRNYGYQYDANQRLTQITNSPYGQFLYDARGNVRSNGKDSFSYDEANHLRTITNTLNNRNWQLYYDTQGQRAFQLKDGKAIYSFYGRNGKLLFERDELSNQQRDYLYFGNQMVSKIAGPLAP